MFRLPTLLRRGGAGRRNESGQVLVIVAAGLIGLIAMVGLVIDGGNAWGHQRMTQNGADSVAKAGTVVILEWLGGESTNTVGDVGCAVDLAEAEMDVTVEDAQFTTFDGSLLGIPVPDCGTAGSIHEDAQGVRAITTQQVDTFLMGVVGINQITARADAIAIVGPVAGTGIGLPVTFPQTMDLCDDSDSLFTIRDWNDPQAGVALVDDDTWQPYEILPSREEDLANSIPTSGNMSIIPLCDTAPGSVGWLDFGCGNLAEQINDPCDVFVPIPGWVATQTGNINCCEVELQAYHGDLVGEYEPERRLDGTIDTNPDVMVKLPIHTTTCEDPPVPPVDSNNDLTPCPGGQWDGQGTNIDYGVPFWVAFVLDEAYVQGGDTECEEEFGTPRLDNPGGGVGCLKGWFVKRIGPPDAVSIGDVDPDDDIDLGITLIN